MFVTDISLSAFVSVHLYFKRVLRLCDGEYTHITKLQATSSMMQAGNKGSGTGKGGSSGKGGGYEIDVKGLRGRCQRGVMVTFNTSFVWC